MPLQGFLCELTGDRVSPEACLACAQTRPEQDGVLCPLAPPLVRGILANAQPRDLPAYSVTELLGCPRKLVLAEHTPYWALPSSLYALFRGTLGHAIVEQYHDAAEVVAEHRYYATFEGMLLTGQPDVVYPAQRLVVDYKTTKRVPQPRRRYACPECDTVIRRTPYRARKGSRLTCPACGWSGQAGTDITATTTPAAPYAEHAQQVSLYRWLLHQNGVAVERAEIVYLDMAQSLRLKAALLSLEECEALLHGRLAALLECGADGLPQGVWDDPDQTWRCGYCAVAETCAAKRSPDPAARGAP